jgi:hypothetical protein
MNGLVKCYFTSLDEGDQVSRHFPPTLMVPPQVGSMVFVEGERENCYEVVDVQHQFGRDGVYRLANVMMEKVLDIAVREESRGIPVREAV